MKKFFNTKIAVGGIALLLCAMFLISGLVGGLFGVSHAETNAEVNRITVVGTGEVKIAPDTAIVSLGVETLNENLSVAQKENAEKINSVVNTLKSIGIADEDIKTKNLYIYQRYDYTNGEKFVGYQVSNYIDFKTKDIEGVGSLISQLTENGANRFSGINFTIEDKDSVYKQALLDAFENAKDKASALTNREQSDAEIVEENCYSYSTKEYSLMNAGESSIFKGEICVKASVKVTFVY